MPGKEPWFTWLSIFYDRFKETEIGKPYGSCTGLRIGRSGPSSGRVIVLLSWERCFGLASVSFDQLTDWVNEWLTDGLTDWLAERLTGWRTYWLTNYLMVWLSDNFVKIFWWTASYRMGCRRDEAKQKQQNGVWLDASLWTQEILGR